MDLFVWSAVHIFPLPVYLSQTQYHMPLSDVSALKDYLQYLTFHLFIYILYVCIYRLMSISISISVSFCLSTSLSVSLYLSLSL